MRSVSEVNLVVNKTEAELCQHFVHQVGHLRRSLGAFAAGVWEEAERLASAVSILALDRGRSRSLISRLGKADEITMLRTKSRAVIYSRLPICCVHEWQGEPRYFPLFMAQDDVFLEVVEINLSDWSNETVYTYNPGERLTRVDLVKSLRDQDGGAHVDGQLTEHKYHLIKSMGNDSLLIKDGKPYDLGVARAPGPIDDGLRDRLRKPPYRGNPPIPGAHWAAMAQVAWELDQSLIRSGLIGAVELESVVLNG